MNKHITLSLLIMSTTFAHAMEDDSWRCCSWLRTYLSTWLSPKHMHYKAKLMSDIRTNKDNFENQLPFSLMEKTNGIITMLYGFDVDRIQTEPSKFLQYCYYYTHWEDDRDMMQLKDLDTPLLKECHKTQIDGYSALSAAIIAKNASIEQKRNFIQELINNRFKPTQKDVELAKLILYDEITDHKTLLHILYSQANWSVLPPEIRKHITRYMLQLFKKEFWLLPETSLNDL